jgi:hypothetical protein
MPIHTQTIPSPSEFTHRKSHPPHRILLALSIECLTRHHGAPRIAPPLHYSSPKPNTPFYSIAARISTAPRIHFMPVARFTCISTRSPSVSPHLTPPSRTHVRPHPHAHTAVLFTVRTRPRLRIGRHPYWGPFRRAQCAHPIVRSRTRI